VSSSLQSSGSGSGSSCSGRGWWVAGSSGGGGGDASGQRVWPVLRGRLRDRRRTATLCRRWAVALQEPAKSGIPRFLGLRCFSESAAQAGSVPPGTGHHDPAAVRGVNQFAAQLLLVGFRIGHGTRQEQGVQPASVVTAELVSQHSTLHHPPMPTAVELRGYQAATICWAGLCSRMLPIQVAGGRAIKGAAFSPCSGVIATACGRVALHVRPSR